MNFVENVLNKLFPDSKTSVTSFIEETLNRNTHERLSYYNWYHSDAPKRLDESVYLAYFLKKRGINTSLNLQLFHSCFVNAISVSGKEVFKNPDFQHYFDYLKNNFLKLGYVLEYAGREVNDHPAYVETIERYYLTFPENLKIGGRRYQLYGNILLEQVQLDDRPDYIKIMANHHPENEDYFPPLAFDELMEKLFMTEE